MIKVNAYMSEWIENWDMNRRDRESDGNDNE